MSVCVLLYFYTFWFFLHIKTLNVCLDVWTFVRFLFMYHKSLENRKRTTKVNKPFIC